MRGRPLPDVFAMIYRERRWGRDGSASGTGSDLSSTVQLRAELPVLLRELGVRSVLDAGCGDAWWVRHADLGDLAYVGVDVVPAVLVEPVARRRRLVADLRVDALPAVDAVLCRDVLVHLSYADGLAALANLRRTGARWLLATTFPGARNTDIDTGLWRPIDLAVDPYRLGPPARIIDEGAGQKRLGVWRLSPG